MFFCLHGHIQAQDKGELNQKLLMAAYEGDLDSVLSLLLDSADVNARTSEGFTPLMYACDRGFEDMVQVLLYNGADPNIIPRNGRTAFLAACANGYEMIAYYLLEYGARPAQRDENGAGALILAVQAGHYSMVDYLLQWHLNPNMAANDSTTPLMVASSNKQNDIAALLLKNGALPDADDADGFTALSIAIESGNMALVDTLLKHGAGSRLMLKTKPVLNPLDYARVINRRDMVKFLRSKGMKGTPAPFISQVGVGFHPATFNFDDYLMGLSVHVRDLKYQFSAELGFDARLKRKRILEKPFGEDFYQLWEKRYVLYLGLEKLFNLSMHNPRLRHGITLSARCALTFGNYEGLGRNPSARVLFVPGAGYSVGWRNFFIKASYHYMDLDIYEQSPHWVNITTGFNINMNRKKLEKKSIWY